MIYVAIGVLERNSLVLVALQDFEKVIVYIRLVTCLVTDSLHEISGLGKLGFLRNLDLELVWDELVKLLEESGTAIKELLSLMANCLCVDFLLFKRLHDPKKLLVDVVLSLKFGPN